MIEGHTADVSVSLDSVRYDQHTGLIPVVVQSATTREVLMVAFANREALKRTFATRLAWFWSRSRQSLWCKGRTSGNLLHVQSVSVDCDGDSVLYVVHPDGPACHTGEQTCFYRELTFNGAGTALVEKDGPASPTDHPATRALNPSANSEDAAVLSDLWNTIDQRFHDRTPGSYTAFLFSQGLNQVAKKVGEEAVEVVIAAKNAEGMTTGTRELIAESADLLFHLLMLWKVADLSASAVYQELRARMNRSR